MFCIKDIIIFILQCIKKESPNEGTETVNKHVNVSVDNQSL